MDPQQEQKEETGGENSGQVFPRYQWGMSDRKQKKRDEHGAIGRTEKEYVKCSNMRFTETWLQDHLPGSNLFLPSFQTIRAN